MASKRFIGPIHSRATSSTVSARYTSQSVLATSDMRGKKRSWVIPVVSALYSWVAPPPKMGISATVKTTIPTPPCHWVRLRQKSSDLGKDSTSEKTLAPVVVKPEIVSKKASRTFDVIPDKRKGSVPTRERSSQTNVTVSIPSLRVACFFFSSLPKKARGRPKPRKASMVTIQGRRLSWKAKARSSTTTIIPASKRHIMPRIRLIKRKLIECIILLFY